jgi:predicted permease
MPTFRRLRALLHGDQLDRAMNAEVRFHIDMETEKYVRQGMDPRTARTQALRNFGPMEKHKEETREARGVSWFEELVQDLKYGARTLVKNKGFAFVAILTLGLGIGANTAIFSVINGVLLKPLPYDNGSRLLLVQQQATLANQPNFGVSIKELYDYREQLASFDGLVEFHQMSFDLLRRGEPDRVATGVVSANFFDVLGIRPIHGRTFVDTDDDPGAEAVLVLGYDYWRSKFAGDPAIVGQVFEMNDRQHTVIGVLPSVPHYPNPVDVYMPTSACPFRAAAEKQINANRRAFAGLQVFGLLKPGTSPEAAATEVTTVAGRFRQDFPNIYRENLGYAARTSPVLAALTQNARPMLLILLGTTGMILLIACANVANLTLARVLRRDRELAMRAALGAGRGRLVRQLLTESTLISFLGGVVGLGFAWVTVDALTLFVGRFTQRTGEIGIDPWVLAFTLGISVVTGLVFGTFPALASRIDLASAMKQGSKGAGVGGGRRLVQNGLIVAQVAVSVVLLVGASLLLTSFYRLQQVDSGYKGEQVLTGEIFGNFSRYPNAETQLRFYEPLITRLRALPGVASAAVTNAVPLTAANPGRTPFLIEGKEVEPERRPVTSVSIASPAYFDTLGIPIIGGRAFTDLDHREAPRVAIINQAMVQYWEGKDPIGSRITPGNTPPNQEVTWYTVVGIASNIRQFGLERDAVGQVYIPLAQTQGGLPGRLLVRASGDPVALTNGVRDAVHALDPDMPVENVRTLDELRDTYLATPRLTATLLTLFAALALAVTLTGITGVIATSVSQRTQEFGVRMAMGASRDGVLLMVLRQGLWLVALGLVIGLGASLGLARVLSTYLYATAPRDPFVLAAVAGLFIVAGTLACLGPARRATAVDPLVALRAE